MGRGGRLRGLGGGLGWLRRGLGSSRCRSLLWWSWRLLRLVLGRLLRLVLGRLLRRLLMLVLGRLLGLVLGRLLRLVLGRLLRLVWRLRRLLLLLRLLKWLRLRL